jgi:hypothetical protein
MTLITFLEKTRSNTPVSFNETIAIITEYYHYQPTEFSNGSLVNDAGSNEGSCKIFAFGLSNNLTEQQTLKLFGDYYVEVLNDPDGSGHQNIRNFMRDGWQGISFKNQALKLK